MKRIIFFILGAALSTGSFAQKMGTKKVETKRLETTIADKKEDKHEAARDAKHFRVKKAIKGRKEVIEHTADPYTGQPGILKRHHGVKHPIHDAHVKVKADKDRRKGKD